MAYNKFIKKDGTVLLDLTGDTITKETLAVGVTAHDKYGNSIAGEGNLNAVCESHHVIEVTTLPDDDNTIDEDSFYLYNGAYYKWEQQPGESDDKAWLKYWHPTSEKKTETPDTVQKIVRPSTGVDYLTEVTIEAIPSEYCIPTGTKYIDIDSNSDETVIGKDIDVAGYKYVKIDYVDYVAPDTQPSTEEITVTPTDTTQVITPTNAEYISKVTIQPIPSEYIVPDGDMEITENGTYNVTNKETVTVNIPIYDGIMTIGDIASANIISFTIDGITTPYQAEEGMTWADWCNSAYNTDGWEMNDMTMTPYLPSTNYAITGVSMTDVINDGETYYTQMAPSFG